MQTLNRYHENITKTCLSRKKLCLSRQRILLVRPKTCFVATKRLSLQKWYLWQLTPTQALTGCRHWACCRQQFLWNCFILYSMSQWLVLQVQPVTSLWDVLIVFGTFLVSPGSCWKPKGKLWVLAEKALVYIYVYMCPCETGYWDKLHSVRNTGSVPGAMIQTRLAFSHKTLHN